MIADLGPGPIALDTAIFIYFIEEHPDYLPLLAPLFSAVASGERDIVTSAVTLLEVLVVPSYPVSTASRHVVSLQDIRSRTAAHYGCPLPGWTYPLRGAE
jgi:hypothetical protein